MIIPNLAHDTVMKSVKKVIGHTDDKVTKRRMKMIDYYEGEYDEYITPYFEGGVKLPPTLPNFTHRMVSARSLVYKDRPIRLNERYTEYLPQDIDSKMRQMEKMTFLTGNMCMSSMFDGEKLQYDIIPYFFPLFIEGSTEEAAVFYPIANMNDRTKRMYEFWSKTTDDHIGMHMKFDEKGKIHFHEDNVFDILPFTFAKRNQELVDEYWQAGALDIVSAQEHVAILYTEAMIAARIDALGIKYVTGVMQDTPIRAGVEEIIMLPDGATMNKLPAGDLNKIVELIKFIIQDTASNNHLVARWADSQANSGVQVKLENLENYEARAASVEDTWRPFEHNRFKVDQAILAANNINVDDDYHVDFTEPETVHDPKEQRDQYDWELANGLTTKRRILEELNPDLDEESIQELLGEIQEEEPTAEPAQPQSILDIIGG